MHLPPMPPLLWPEADPTIFYHSVLTSWCTPQTQMLMGTHRITRASCHLQTSDDSVHQAHWKTQNMGLWGASLHSSRSNTSGQDFLRLKPALRAQVVMMGSQKMGRAEVPAIVRAGKTEMLATCCSHSSEFFWVIFSGAWQFDMSVVSENTALLLRHVQLPAKDLTDSNTSLDLFGFQFVFPDSWHLVSSSETVHRTFYIWWDDMPSSGSTWSSLSRVLCFEEQHFDPS